MQITIFKAGENIRDFGLIIFIIPLIICSCLLYTSDAADERSSVDLGGRRIIKKKTDIDPVGLLTK